MAQFPVEDSAGVLEGINYLLSGPAGLGQNFEGFKSFDPAYISAYFRQPFSFPVYDADGNPIVLNEERTKWFSSDVTIDNIVGIDDYTFEIFFASPLPATAPFYTGQAIEVSGTTSTGSDPTFFNDYWQAPGVISCSTSSVIIQNARPYVWPTATGGVARLNAADTYVSTDANGRVQVSSPQDKVFVSAQIKFDFDYESDDAGFINVLCAINRLAGFQDTRDPNNKDYLFAQTTRVARLEKRITIPAAGTGTITDTEFIFSTVIDTPTYTVKENNFNVTKGYGYYWYILELYFESEPAGQSAITYPTQVVTNYRSLTAQVIKQ